MIDSHSDSQLALLLWYALATVSLKVLGWPHALQKRDQWDATVPSTRVGQQRWGMSRDLALPPTTIAMWVHQWKFI